MKTVLHNQKGEKAGEIDLSPHVFETPMNKDLLHQAVVSYQSHLRRGTAHTKTRAEVSGGGRKPWPQKGTGRARHGSIRSPLWVGGGTTFGPRKQKKYKKRIPKKMKKKALRIALSDKLKRGNLVVLDTLELEKPKTKIMAKLMGDLKRKLKKEAKGSTLLILSAKDKNVFRATGNLPRTRVKLAQNINALDAVKYKYLFITKKAIKTINKRFTPG